MRAANSVLLYMHPQKVTGIAWLPPRSGGPLNAELTRKLARRLQRDGEFDVGDAGFPNETSTPHRVSALTPT